MVELLHSKLNSLSILNLRIIFPPELHNMPLKQDSFFEGSKRIKLSVYLATYCISVPLLISFSIVSLIFTLIVGSIYAQLSIRITFLLNEVEALKMQNNWLSGLFSCVDIASKRSLSVQIYILMLFKSFSVENYKKKIWGARKIKEFSKSVKLKWIYYWVEYGRMAFDNVLASYNLMPCVRIIFFPSTK